MTSADVRRLLRHHFDTPVEARLQLCVRNAPHHVVADLARAVESQLGTVAAWLGWPNVTRDTPVWPDTIRKALALRSNDYWLLDLAARCLGLDDLCRSQSPEVGWPSGVSVVVPARGVEHDLPGMLDALVKSATRLPKCTPWECLVVDDANAPPLRLASGLPPHVHLIRSDRHLYCSGARNLGLARAQYDLVVFCDADTHLGPNYLSEHYFRHALAPNLIAVSLREHVPDGAPVPDRSPAPDRDTRIEARYSPSRIGLVPVAEPLTVRPLAQTRDFRDFGHGRLLGPVDLPFMVKGNNLSMDTATARSVTFPLDFIGWGPEDACFAAKCIARGAWVVPVLSTGVFHRDHPPRSGSTEQRDAELVANLARYRHHLDGAVDTEWSNRPAWKDVTP